tara:strand:- start:43584 stop:43988 length:405 start_codon:yes stop_codon:yes gene_type:complete
MDDSRATSSAHSPGPWNWSWTTKDKGSWSIYTTDEFTGHDCGGNPIADVCYREHGERFANTRLIAAAPKLLQKCKEYSITCTTRIEVIQDEEGQYCDCDDKGDHDRHCDAGEQIGHWQAIKDMVDAVINEAEGQ